jgi:hypothetical protein
MTTIYNDDVKVTLIASIDETTTTLSVSNPAGIYLDPPSPTGGQIATLKIVDRINNPTRREIITYTGRSAITGGFSLTGVTRGAVPMLWEAGCFLIGVITATTDTSVLAEIDALQVAVSELSPIGNGIYASCVLGGFYADNVPKFVCHSDGRLVMTKIK